MKIKHIEAIPLRRELETAFLGGTYKITTRPTVVCRVELDDGTVGEIFGGDEEQYQAEVVALVNTHYRPLLVGKDVRDIEWLWETMWNVRVDFGNRGIHTLDLAKHCIHTQAIAAADLALWDALGKALGQPVARLLGGYEDKVRVIGIGGYMNPGKTADDLEAEIAGFRERGIFGMKLKVGKNSVEEDIERARVARKSGGNDFLLCTDANQSWTVDQAVAFARGVRDLGLAWLEEPVRWHDQHSGNARIRQEGVPVNAGQGEISRHGCRDLITSGAVDILNVDATIAGGVTEWRRIAAMAQCFGIRMAHHEEPQVALHLLSSIPNGIAVEIFPSYQRDPMWFDLPTEQPNVQDGFMHLPPGAGFGIPLRQEIIEKYRVGG